MDRRKAIVIWLMVVCIVGIIGAWQALEAMTRGSTMGEVYEVGNGKITLIEYGEWFTDYRYRGDNYPEVGKWIRAHYENGDVITDWQYCQKKGVNLHSLALVSVFLAVAIGAIFAVDLAGKRFLGRPKEVKK